MRCVQLTQIGHPLEERQLPVPAPGPGEVLVNVRAAGICRSDTHYRSGLGETAPLPLTPGHEVAGEVAQLGVEVEGLELGDHVALHYLVCCGKCRYCLAGNEQFCETVSMIGKDRSGGFAQQIVVPKRNCIPLPESIPFEHGAVLMCACATALHAIERVRLLPSETVVILGVGGLGLAAVQIAFARGAEIVMAVDIVQDKLDAAAEFGAIGINASRSNIIEDVLQLTEGRGADVALEFAGHPDSILAAIRCLAQKGRVALAGITGHEIPLKSYSDIIGKEAEVIGVSDHTLAELYELVQMVVAGQLDLGKLATQKVPLDADAINKSLDALEQNSAPVRTVITHL